MDVAGEIRSLATLKGAIVEKVKIIVNSSWNKRYARSPNGWITNLSWKREGRT